jgi:hypothetical protein
MNFINRHSRSWEYPEDTLLIKIGDSDNPNFIIEIHLREGSYHSIMILENHYHWSGIVCRNIHKLSMRCLDVYVIHRGSYAQSTTLENIFICGANEIDIEQCGMRTLKLYGCYPDGSTSRKSAIQSNYADMPQGHSRLEQQ